MQACLLGSAETLSPSAFFRGGSFSLEEEGEVSDTGSFVSFVFFLQKKKKHKKTNEIKIWRWAIARYFFFNFAGLVLYHVKTCLGFFAGDGEGIILQILIITIYKK